MKYGHFDDQRREYVIENCRTPSPWINYLGAESFFALVSNTAGGYAFYRDAKLRRLTRYRYNNLPLDQDGFHIYVNDAGTLWNPGFQPCRTELDSYECRHGLGYSVITGANNGLKVSQELYVPCGDNVLLNRVTAVNTSAAPKSFDLFSFVEFCLWDALDDSTNFQRNWSTGEVETEPGRIYHKTEFRERRNHFAAYFSDRTPDSFDTSRDAFIGKWSSAAEPQAVVAGRCSDSVCHGFQPCGAFHYRVVLQSGESFRVILGLSYNEVPEDEKFIAPGVINKSTAQPVISRYSTDEGFDKGLAELNAFWAELLSGFEVSTGDEKLDRMVNIWNAYQCMVTFNMSRSASYYESGIGRGMGFRDSCQDLLGFVHMIPARARERILDIAATQKPDGGAYHQYQPLTKTGNADIGGGFNDDPLWLIACTDAYIRETGDMSILSEQVDFDNKPELAAPLLEHLRRSFSYTLNNLGPHSLPLIGRADWNDCLNLNCFSAHPGESFQVTGPSEGPVAESVFIAGMFVKYGRAFADILKKSGLENEAAEARRATDEMEKAVLASGWDGEWFLRAYDAFGDKVGSKECDEGQIFIEPQGMCVMAGIGAESGEALKALDSVKERLETKFGIVLLNPAYTTYHLNLGEISSYPPGYKENAAIFCHNNPWVVMAETVMGRGARALELYKKTCPAYLEDVSDIRCVEPYVYCQMTAGKDAPTFGEGKNSWLTGTAAWTFVALTQGILGIVPDYDGLVIDPCIPAELRTFTVNRLFRGTMYRITVENLSGSEKGVRQLFVDGAEVPVGPIAPEGRKEIAVRAVM